MTGVQTCALPISSGRFTEAATVLDKALDADPNSPAAHAGYGRHFEMQKNLKEATRYYERALALGDFSTDFSSALLEEIRARRKSETTPP